MSTPAQVLDALLRERFSCRAYRPEPVARQLIERIVEQAQRTASWCNAQPWQVHIASAAATQRLRQALRAHVAQQPAGPDLPFPREYHGVYQERRRACGLQLYRAAGVERGDALGAERQRQRNFEFFDAPHVAIVTTEAALGTYGVLDCGAFVQNLLLSARAHGVASIAQAALALYPGFWREAFQIAPQRQVVCGISLGYEDTAAAVNGFRTERADRAQVMGWLD